MEKVAISLPAESNVSAGWATLAFQVILDVTNDPTCDQPTLSNGFGNFVSFW
jgi:hypothetical protein